MQHPIVTSLLWLLALIVVLDPLATTHLHGGRTTAETDSRAYCARLTFPGKLLIALVEGRETAITTIQPELWVDAPSEAVTFYEAAFGATVLHRVGEGDDIVAQLAVGDAAFWVAGTSASMRRLSPRAIGGATSRTLLVLDDPENVVRQAVVAGATESSPVANEHG